MKKVILEDSKYTFDASAKTLTFTEDIILQHLLLVTNITSNQIIYNFACDGYGGTLSGKVVTLEYDTTSMLDTDTLTVMYYMEEYPVESEQIEILKNLDIQTDCLQNILSELRDINENIQDLA
jgi:hypothetical protein